MNQIKSKILLLTWCDWKAKTSSSAEISVLDSTGVNPSRMTKKTVADLRQSKEEDDWESL